MNKGRSNVKIIYNSGIIFESNRDSDFASAYASALVSGSGNVLKFLEQERNDIKNNF